MRIFVAPLIFIVEGLPARSRDGERLLVGSIRQVPLLKVSATKDAVNFWEDHLPLVVDEHTDFVFLLSI